MKEAIEEWIKVLCKIIEQNGLIEEAKKKKKEEERKIYEAKWMGYNQMI